ncbi:MAG: YraN family protein [Leucobacter sp.]
MNDIRTAERQALGLHGEQLAAEYLTRAGFLILERNWRNRHGELDIVARDRGTIVAVEVKTRSGTGYGHPFEAITALKASRLRRLLLDWSRSSGVRGIPLRIDAVGITLPKGSAPCIEHLRGIS